MRSRYLRSMNQSTTGGLGFVPILIQILSWLPFTDDGECHSHPSALLESNSTAWPILSKSPASALAAVWLGIPSVAWIDIPTRGRRMRASINVRSSDHLAFTSALAIQRPNPVSSFVSWSDVTLKTVPGNASIACDMAACSSGERILSASARRSFRISISRSALSPSIFARASFSLSTARFKSAILSLDAVTSVQISDSNAVRVLKPLKIAEF
jgi:hypothetical protein